VKNILENFKRVAKKHNLNLASSTTNSLSNFIKTGKDQLSVSSHCNVVYQIDCNDCEASYVSQTKRQLNTRMREHLNDIKKSTGTRSVSDHRLELNHDFNWEEVRILDKEPSWKKRIVSEMIHIKKQRCGINKHSDTEFLPENYLPIINYIVPPSFLIHFPPILYITHVSTLAFRFYSVPYFRLVHTVVTIE